MLYSGPPSPIAAPLPEYFSYDLGNLSDENRRKKINSLSALHKEKIIQKFTSLQMTNSKNFLFKSRNFQEKLEKIIKSNPKDSELLQFFEEEGIPVSEREKLVYEVINSIRFEGVHVKLEDMIEELGKNYSETGFMVLKDYNRKDDKSIDEDSFGFDAKRKNKKVEVPHLNLRNEDKGKCLARRSSTPGKKCKDGKNVKRTKTPISKKQKNDKC